MTSQVIVRLFRMKLFLIMAIWLQVPADNLIKLMMMRTVAPAGVVEREVSLVSHEDDARALGEVVVVSHVDQELVDRVGLNPSMEDRHHGSWFDSRRIINEELEPDPLQLIGCVIHQVCMASATAGTGRVLSRATHACAASRKS